MFEIQVGHLLESYSGDSESFDFEGEVTPGFYEDLEFTTPLTFRITLISLGDGIEAIIENLETSVEYEFSPYDVQITKVSRTFKKEHDPLLSDDVKFIDKKHSTIDLKEVLREEIIMAVAF